MEVKKDVLKGHKAKINSILTDICHAPVATVFVRERNLCLESCGTPPLTRSVVSDLDVTESAIGLPIPNSASPNFWLAFHEKWEAKGKHKLHFRDCGIRIYTGPPEEDTLQILRLEWVAPTTDADGQVEYQGGRAGHPHWHIDRSAFVGMQEQYDALEALTAPPPAPSLEEFSENVTPLFVSPQASPYDCSWISRLHLPSQAVWTKSVWNGMTVPGPHQNEPSDIEELDAWWAGALRYLASELRQAT